MVFARTVPNCQIVLQTTVIVNEVAYSVKLGTISIVMGTVHFVVLS